MKPVKLINIKNPVFKIKVTVDGLIYVLDVNNILRIYNENFKLKDGMKIKLSPHKLFENSADISFKGNYVAIADKSKKTFIYDVKNKKVKYKFGWHKGEVLSLSFDFEEEYLISGGMDGRAYLWSLKYGRMLLALPPHPDYILSSGFSKNNLWVATGSYDRLITITNIASSNVNYRKKSHRGAVNNIKFFKNTMISADKTGEMIKWDFRKGKIINRFSNMADMVVDFVSDEKEQYLFAVTKEKRVYLYDFDSGELITNEYIKLLEYPSVIEYNANLKHLYVGCVDGSLYIYDLLKDEKRLQELINVKNYAKAYELIKENPFLKQTKEYNELENIWEKTLQAIQKFLEKGEIDKAKYLFEPFKNEPIKRNIFQSLLKDYGEFEKFKNAVINKRYPLAYSLVKNYPILKESVYYKNMEKDFKNSFNKARELIKLRRVEEAKEILKPFRGVSEKAALIQTLFNEKRLYDLLRKLLAKRDFKEFFELINRYPFLTDTQEYEKAINYAKLAYQKANEALQKGDYKTALKLAEILKDFPSFKEKAEDIYKKATNILSFLMYIADKNYDEVEKMVNNYPYLEELEDYKKLMKNYKSLINEGERYALSGNISKLKEVFRNYINFNLFKDIVYKFIKRAYLNQLMGYLKSKNIEKIKKGINNYIKLFGFDNEVGDLMKMAKKLGVNFSIENYEKSVNIPFSSLPDDIAEVEI